MMNKIFIILISFVIAPIFANESAIVKYESPELDVYLCEDTVGIVANIYTFMDFYSKDSLFRFTDYYLRVRPTSIHRGIDLRHIEGTPIYAPYDCILLGKLTQREKFYKLIESIKPDSLRETIADSILVDSVECYDTVGFGNYAWYYAPGPDITFIIAHLESLPTHHLYETFDRDDFLAIGGNTGTGTGDHLHLETMTGFLYNACNKLSRASVRINPEPHYFNETPSADLSYHFNLLEYEKQDTIEDYSRDISSHNFFDERYRTEKGTRCYNPYIVTEPLPGPGSYAATIDVMANYFDMDSIHFNSNHTQVTQTFGYNKTDTIACKEHDFRVLNCVVVVTQTDGYVDGDLVDLVFNPNIEDENCDATRGPSNYEALKSFTSPNDAIYHASGEAFFVAGHGFKMECPLASNPEVNFSYSVAGDGSATWDFSGPRSVVCASSSTVRVTGIDTTLSIQASTGLWFFQTLTYGMQKTNKSSENTSLTFVCPYCPQHPSWEDDSWSRTGCQQTADMVMRIHPVLKYESNTYNTDRSDYLVKEIMDFDVDDVGTNSYGYTGDIVGNDSYAWTKNGGYSTQSSFTLLDVDPSSYWYREWLCCRHIGEDCPCSNLHYDGNCGFDNQCINIEAENFIFPPWEKEPVTAFARALTDSTDTTLKSTFHNMDSLMPGRAVISKVFNDPDSVSKRLLLEIHGASPDMIIWAYPCTTDWPHQDRSSFDYETERIHVPYIEDEDTLETLAIPNDYQIPIIAKPNPFNTEVSITFELEHEENCVVSIYDIEGSLREVIFDGIVSSRSKTLSWQCSSCPSGTYFVVVTTPSTYSTKKISLVK